MDWRITPPLTICTGCWTKGGAPGRGKERSGKDRGHACRSIGVSEWTPQRVAHTRGDDGQAVGLEMEIVSRLAMANWREEWGDPMVEDDPEAGEQAVQRVPLDDQVLKADSEFLLLILASERTCMI